MCPHPMSLEGAGAPKPSGLCLTGMSLPIEAVSHSVSSHMGDVRSHLLQRMGNGVAGPRP